VELDKLLELIQLDVLMRNLSPTTFPPKSKLYEESLFRFLEESILFTLLHIVSKFVQSKPYDDFMRSYNATFGICRAKNQNAPDTARGGVVIRYVPVVSLPRDRKARIFQQDVLDLQLHLQQEGVVKRLSGERRSRSVNITPERGSSGRRGLSIERAYAAGGDANQNNTNDRAIADSATGGGGGGGEKAPQQVGVGVRRTSLERGEYGRATPERKRKLSGKSKLHNSAGAMAGQAASDAPIAPETDFSDTNFNQIKTRVIYRHDEEYEFFVCLFVCFCVFFRSHLTLRYTTSLIAVFKESNKFDPSDFQLAGPNKSGKSSCHII
jgi:hypothetical protein